jgi:hypothetical protein
VLEAAGEDLGVGEAGGMVPERFHGRGTRSGVGLRKLKVQGALCGRVSVWGGGPDWTRFLGERIDFRDPSAFLRYQSQGNPCGLGYAEPETLCGITKFLEIG